MRFLIERKITISMLFIALTFLGYISYRQLSMELLPKANAPRCSVNINGTSNYDPKYLEAEVIVPLEGIVAQCSGVQEITSTVNSYKSTIDIEFKPNVNIKSAYIRLSELVNEFAGGLPDEFNVWTTSAGSQNMINDEFMALRVKGDYDVDEILAITESEVEERLANIEGIVDVVVYGGRGKSVEIELIPELCDALKITTKKVSSALTNAGDERIFAGYVTNGADENSIFIDGGYSSVAMIGNVVVADGPVFLKDIASITSSLKEPTTISRLDGERTITVSLAAESGENIIELAERTRKEIDELNKLFESQGISMVVVSCSADEIESNINQLAWLGLLGALLAIVILWFFLHNFRLIFSIALAIPISVFAAFNIFYAMDVSINSITLIGIALAVGMLLDNSIVVLENIYRLYSSGESAESAVIDGTKQVWRSIIASTLTTITVFLPFVFTSDIMISLMGLNLGVAIISTLLFSLLVALLLIPMLTYVTLKSKAGVIDLFSENVSIHERPIQLYTIVLKWVIRRSTPILCITIVALCVSFIWTTSRDEKSMRNIKSDKIVLGLTMTSENDVMSNDATVAEFEKHLKDIKELKEMSCTVGESRAYISLLLNEGFDKGEGSRDINEIVDEVWRRINPIRKGINIWVWTGSSSPNNNSSQNSMLAAFGVGERKNVLLIKGSDYDAMRQVGEDIRDILSEVEYVGNVSLSVEWGAREVKVEMDPYAVNELGITKEELSSSLTGLTKQQDSGAKIKFGDDETTDIIITMKSDSIKEKENLKSLRDLKELQVESSNGGLYSLQDIAYIYKGYGKGTIKRVDRSREMKLTYSFSLSDLTEDIINSYNTEIDDIIAEYPITSGVVIEREEIEDEFAEFKFLIFASVLLIFMILASVFESFTMPLILMFAIPLAAIGSFTALILTNNSLMNLNTLTGFMILLGVVVNGGIILIDYINLLRNKGYSRNRAILMSGASRLRPIMITTITTVVALLPMALGSDDYAGAIGAPFAITVIGGLTFSSLLTLVLVPTLYVFLEETFKWYRTLSRWIYVLHGGLMAIILANLLIGVDDIYQQMGYFTLAIVLIPAITYMVLHSVRVADNSIIDPNLPIVIEAKNIVKIYDRAGQFERELTAAGNRRRSLDIENKYLDPSDLKDVLWQGTLAVMLLLGATLYFESAFWITIMLAGQAMLTIMIWNALYRFGLNYRAKRGEEMWGVVRLIDLVFNAAVIVGAIATFALVTDNFGVAGIYLGLVALGYGVNYTARMIERENINLARLEGRFAALKGVIFSIVLAVPIIGKRRKPFEALKGVTFTIKSGMFGLLGPNGAGKSTFMRIITGLYEPSYGSIFINGLDIRKYREELQSLIGFLPQEFGTYEYMTPWNFLDYQAILKGVSDEKVRMERLDYVLKAVHMYEKKDHPIGSFSGGMKQRIGIALILLNLPRILVVDEPTAGLDPRERIRFRNLLVELSRDRIVIFSTHIIEDIASSCNQVAVIKRGELQYFGDPNNMIYFAQKKVWSFTVDEEDFKRLDSTLVANNMKNSDGTIKVRYISVDSPWEGAVQEVETLEDAYLCMLKGL
ncbi:MAG: efflux RND transporter permease subunit [Rikenellaceae bacterium]